ncbi:MAG: Cys-Gln thioester bond-forming surface protein [Oscillospiraceae bacterium]|nr:Cys-Gln thioester bond-forming surface protein [Oscillospiraceae bacterium]
MKNGLKHRLIAAVLAVCTVLGMGIPANAASIADGSKTCTVALAPVHTYLQTTAGTWLRACGYDYTTNDGLTGPAYCIDHGLAYTGKVLPITGKYEASAKTAGAFANGYPQHSLDTFLGLHLAGNPVLAGLTEYEYRYATQVAVWATLGQLAVDGTQFTDGRERLSQPSGDLQQERVFRAVQVILDFAKNWDRIYKTGMYIRTQENALGGNTALPSNMTLEAIANRNIEGIRMETIAGVTYYTKTYYVASATSTYPQGYTIDLWTTGAPAGTKFVDMRNVELTRSRWHETDTWKLPVSVRDTNLNYNDFEYSGQVKLCIPVDNAPPRGEIIIHSAAQILQYEIYLANNDTANEQSYIIADPAKGAIDAEAVLSWGSEETTFGKLKITKVGGGGSPLEGAVFVLTGTDGSRRTGKSDKKGEILWEKLSPTTTYTLSEQTPPSGFAPIDPINVTVKAGQTTYLTIKNDPQHTLTVHKQDYQNGYSLRGAVFRFEQIDGSFTTTAATDHAGNIQFNADQLPIGSYRIFEEAAPDGFEVDPTPQTVHWDGKSDVTLTFRDVRKPTLVISKQDSRTHYNLPDAVFEIYRDGTYVTTVTANDAGLAYVPGVVSGSYYTVVEKVAPLNHLLDETVHGIYINAYDPSTTEDPRIVIENDPLPSLRIVKYDRTSHQGMEAVTFEVFKDTVSLGKYQTDKSGEILLQYVEPGTYRAVEVDTGDDGYILDTTPQEIELKAGDDVRELIFFNDRLPGIHLVKVDSADLSKPVPNARFRFEKVGGGYGPVEYTTLADGTIDLSKLPTGSYVVTELECAGYVVDDAQRIIHLDGNEQAQFIFTNSALPGLHLTKYSSDGTPLAGVSYRLTRVEDGSHYLDRTTSETGEITWDGLEPGVYSLVETSTLETHILDETEYHVELFPGKTSEIVLANDRRPSLTIHKVDASDGVTPVPDTVFLVREVDSSTVTEVKTGPDGTVTLENLLPTVYEVSEKSVPSPYLLDAPSQRITLHPNRDSDIYFANHKAPVIEIMKVDKVTGKAIPGVKFRVWYASNNTATGELNDLGIFTTDQHGRIQLSGPANGLRDGWFRVQEVEAAPGYVIADPDTQEAFVPAGKGHTFRFENTPLGGLEIIKVNASDRSERIPNVTYEIRRASDGGLVDTIVTGKNGRVYTALDSGDYYAVEVDCPSSFKLDSTPHYFEVKDGKTTTLTLTNQPFSGILIHKTDSTTGKGIPNVSFILYDSKQNPIGEYTSDQRGYVYIDDLTQSGRYYLRELAHTGYIPDENLKTVYVKAGETTEVEWKNTPITGQIQVTKTSADYNSVNGWPAGTAISGCEFEVYNKAGNLVDTIRTDKNGIAATRTLPLGLYKVVESKAADFYALDNTPFYVELQFAGQIFRIAATNKSISTGAAITKTGYKEVMPGQMERFTFTGIGNTSTVPLQDFYWRDTIPTDALRLSQVVTGTWNVSSNYKLVYLTNKSGGQYRTLADNLSTQKQYTIDASPVALGLAKDEYVTEVMAVFGIVPAGFHQVENPALDFTVVNWLQNGYQFTNQADAGGSHNGAWVQANTRWVTTVYAPTKPLPRTGY